MDQFALVLSHHFEWWTRCLERKTHEFKHVEKINSQNQNLPTIKDENIHPCGIVSPLVLLCGWESKIGTSDFTSLQVMELIINLNIITVE